jgi:hypothetical protein
MISEHIIAHVVLLQVLSAEDHDVASKMNHHYTTNDYEEDDSIYVPPGEEGSEISHGGREYMDLNELRDGFKELAVYAPCFLVDITTLNCICSTAADSIVALVEIVQISLLSSGGCRLTPLLHHISNGGPKMSFWKVMVTL